MIVDSLAVFSLAMLIPNILCAGDAGAIAGQLRLSSSTALPFPSATMAAEDATAFMKSKWALQGGISFGEKSLAFVDDPVNGSGASPGSGSNSSSKRSPGGSSNSTGSTNSTGSSGPGSAVLAVTYDAGTYSHATGGAQFYATFGGNAGFEAMLLSYDITFDEDFDWVKGGKLPGLRGGQKLDSCSGGREPTGSDCFSSRLMWRADGAGEVYAYIPSQSALCKVDGVICNSDYGFSMGRGKFKFTAGQWQNVAVYSKMNNPPSQSNGELALYFNGDQVFSYSNLKFRTSDTVTAGGMYFSTFFGGNDKSWATPKSVHTYYRNFQIFGGAGGSSGGSSNSTSTSGSGSSSNSLDPSSSTGSGSGSGSGSSSNFGSGSSKTSGSKPSSTRSASDS